MLKKIVRGPMLFTKMPSKYLDEWVFVTFQHGALLAGYPEFKRFMCSTDSLERILGLMLGEDREYKLPPNHFLKEILVHGRNTPKFNNLLSFARDAYDVLKSQTQGDWEDFLHHYEGLRSKWQSIVMDQPEQGLKKVKPVAKFV